jgi:hypothetical protein
MRYITAIGLLLLLSGCGAPPDSALAAAILSSPPHPRLASCLTVLGSDPSPALLASLTAAKRDIAPASKCIKGPAGTVYAHRKRAERLAVVKFRRLLPWRARVELTSYFGPLAASGWVVQLERVNGIWVAKSNELQWISLGPNNSFKPIPLRGTA